ncbi:MULTISPECIES: hypothetical protein [Trichocoleus]|uniref:Uncharacterized protein n=1 Tax=Trichocoleus desertorum GB2-A4 TaxID=2933944 RepID=A0ABV0J3J5_9CYAN|nr:hypothetical protein [Trichocoleus sp. FACHB-46]MBD1861709.1 hypothetical protein [Trichocoleus sp. FACHB-46]
MKIWATTFVVLFGLVELYQWVQHFNWTVTLPLPVFILGGAALAIASNYDKRAGLPFALKFEESKAIANPTPTVINSVTSGIPVQLNSAQKPLEPQLPNLKSQPPHPISFRIQRPESQE